MTTLIKNGTIIDGSGKPMFKTDILIDGDKIKKIGDFGKSKAQTIIDAENLYVTPGFIDILNHSDAYLTLFASPEQESMVRQGVTTIIGGNCGSSLAPLTEANLITSIQKWGDISEINVNWLTLAEFLKEIKKLRLSVNFATLTGHSTLRRGIIGDEFRDMSKDEVDKMELLLERSMQEGSFGLSTGLSYSHGKIAPEEEIIELLQVAKKFGGLYSCHLRDESKDFLLSINETLNTAREADVRLEISHLKIMGRSFWAKFEDGLEMLETASKSGLNVNFDVYPYRITASVLYALLPDWVARGGKETMLARLEDKSIRSKLVKEMQADPYEYEKIIVGMGGVDKMFFGRPITEIAKNQEISVEEAIINLLIAARGRIIAFIPTLSEKNLLLAIRHPLSLIGSGGAGYDMAYKKRGGNPHPRSFGTFPRVLAQYVRDENLITWEEALNKMTGGPAAKLGLKNRGLIKKDFFADIVILNPQTIKDRTTFENPFQYPEGIEYVFVNGKMVIKNGELIRVRNGKVLELV